MAVKRDYGSFSKAVNKDLPESLDSAGLEPNVGKARAGVADLSRATKIAGLVGRNLSICGRACFGTLQGVNNFSTGRASTGVKVAYPWLWSATTIVKPYVGLYGDYYFSGDNGSPLAGSNAAPLLPSLPTQFIQGWSARVTTGFSVDYAGGARMSLGGELGGLGSQNFITWSFQGRVSVPFSP